MGCRTSETVEPDRPEAVARLAEELPGWLAERGAGHVRIEDKGLAIAVHTRGIDPGSSTSSPSRCRPGR